MNPVRSLGPAVVLQYDYKGIWIYVVGPHIGAIAGGFAYSLLKPTDRSFTQLIKRT